MYLQNWIIDGVNVGKYYIHGASGKMKGKNDRTPSKNAGGFAHVSPIELMISPAKLRLMVKKFEKGHSS